jgi:Holliday junction resolvasome RuvABC endonuclease subunit
MLIAGFDCSSKSIACVLINQDKKIIFTSYFNSELDGMDLRLAKLTEGLIEKIEGLFTSKLKPDLVAVENPIFVNNIKATSGIAQVIGATKSSAARYNIPFMGVDNKSWKKAVLSNGNSTKEEIMAFALSNWDKKIILNQDIADASCVALWGLMRKA